MTLKLVRAFLVALVGSVAASVLAWPEVRGWRAWAFVALSAALWGEAWLESWLPSQEPPIVLQPLPPEPVVRNLVQVEAARWVYVYGIPEPDMRRLAMGLLQWRRFTLREWQGEIPAIREVQDQFERAGLVRIVGKRRVLNGRGRRAMLEYLYRGTPLPAAPPPPQGLQLVRVE